MAKEQLQELERRRYYWQRNARTWLFALGLIVLALVALYEFGVRRAYERLQQSTQMQTDAELELKVQILESRLEKYRLLPVLLGRQPPLLEADLRDQNTKVWLQQIRYLTGADEVALIQENGDLIQASHTLLTPTQWKQLNGLHVPPSQGRLGREYVSLNNETILYGFSSKLRHHEDAVLVVLVNLELVLQSWVLSDADVVALDDEDRIVLASNPLWIGQPYASLTEQFAKNERAKSMQKLNAIGWHVEASKALDDRNLVRQSALLSVIVVMSIVATFWLLIRRREIQYKQSRREAIYAQELQTQIDKRTEELKTAQQELIHSAKLATIGQMSTTLSHEYNQPLATMRTYAENAEKFLSMNKLENVRDNLQRIVQQTDRLGQLSKVLMSFARKPTDTMAEVNLRACVEESILLVQPRIKKRACVIEHNIPNDVAVFGNGTSLSQVFLNILTNAVDALNALNDDATHEIKLSCENRSDIIRINIEDDGPGIPEYQHESIFEPFVTTKATRQGLGLGLSVVKDIILAHGGSIRVETNSLGGALFIIDLPTFSENMHE